MASQSAFTADVAGLRRRLVTKARRTRNQICHKVTESTEKMTINAELAEGAEIRRRFDALGLLRRPSCRPPLRGAASNRPRDSVFPRPFPRREFFVSSWSTAAKLRRPDLYVHRADPFNRRMD